MKIAHLDGFEEPAIYTVLKETLKALEYLHKDGHIQCDVKAGNILLDSNGVVKLADFVVLLDGTGSIATRQWIWFQVDTLAVKLTQEEGELIQEKFEVKKLANFLKQASEETKRLVSQERSFACVEIESARAVIQRFGEALEEEENFAQNSGKQDVKELIEEIQEARRIKFLHQPCKVMEMEPKLRELRIRIREMAIFSVKLQKQLGVYQGEENRICMQIIDGAPKLGSIQPRLYEEQIGVRWVRVEAAIKSYK